MDARAYILPYVEQGYLAQHAELTPAARELVHEQIAKNPDKYAVDEHALALIAYANTRAYLLKHLKDLEDLPDEEFERKRNQLFDETRLTLFKITETDKRCFDAELLSILLADTSLDACLAELMKLEEHIRNYLEDRVAGFNAKAEHYWTAQALAQERLGGVAGAEVGTTPELFGSATGSAFETAPVPEASDEELAARLTLAEPAMIAWLHTLESLAQLCLSSARYKAAIGYTDQVLRARGYASRAVGIKLLALARLEDEDGFFEVARQHDSESPWYLLGRTLLLYKMQKTKPAQRALRDFVSRYDGAAFFLLNPTYLMPYLPDRPEPRESWDLAHQAIWEADGILVDTPDFPTWAESVSGVLEASESFANRNGF